MPTVPSPIVRTATQSHPLAALAAAAALAATVAPWASLRSASASVDAGLLAGMVLPVAPLALAVAGGAWHALRGHRRAAAAAALFSAAAVVWFAVAWYLPRASVLGAAGGEATITPSAGPLLAAVASALAAVAALRAQAAGP